MTKSETYISFIIDQIKLGTVEPKNIVSVFCSKFQKTERTFWNQWKIAEKQYSETQNEAKKEFEGKYKQEIEDSLKSSINRKAHKQEILKKIIDGELLTEKLVIIKGEVKKVMAKPDAQDIMKAIDIDNKMEGDYTIKLSTKSDVTISFLD